MIGAAKARVGRGFPGRRPLAQIDAGCLARSWKLTQMLGRLGPLPVCAGPKKEAFFLFSRRDLRPRRTKP